MEIRGQHQEYRYRVLRVTRYLEQVQPYRIFGMHGDRSGQQHAQAKLASRRVICKGTGVWPEVLKALDDNPNIDP